MSGALPRPLGRAIGGEWGLDPGFLTVNHGSYGATPRVVLAAQEAWRGRMEAQPTVFMVRTLPGALRLAAAALGGFLNAAAEDIAFVDNATAGCNAVLRSIDLREGDEILVHGQAYGAVANTARHVARQAGARVVVAPLALPEPDLAGFAARFAGRLGPRTRLAILDHVTSQSALLLPVAEVAAACRAAGVPLLVDGAHGPGQVELDLSALGADFYTGNAHKWLCAPKGCAFLWARRERQAGLHPTIISHGLDGGFLAEFDWTGTRDPSAALSVGAALDFHAALGGAALRARNIALAREGGALLAQALGTEHGNAGHDVAMAMVRLPTGALPPTRENALALRDRLLREFSTDAPLHAHPSGIWLRLSAHAYNEAEDYALLAERCRALVRGL